MGRKKENALVNQYIMLTNSQNKPFPVHVTTRSSPYRNTCSVLSLHFAIMSSARDVSSESAVTLPVAFDEPEVRISMLADQNSFDPRFGQCLFSEPVER
jgi:hypothetical protein